MRGNFSEKVLGETIDVGVGTLLVRNFSTASSSYTARCEGQTKKMGGKHLHKLMDCLHVVVSFALVASSFVFL